MKSIKITSPHERKSLNKELYNHVVYGGQKKVFNLLDIVERIIEVLADKVSEEELRYILDIHPQENMVLSDVQIQY